MSYTTVTIGAKLYAELLEENRLAKKRVRQLEQALGLVMPICGCLHHPKRYQHELHESCPCEKIVIEAQRNKTKGTK